MDPSVGPQLPGTGNGVVGVTVRTAPASGTGHGHSAGPPEGEVGTPRPDARSGPDRPQARPYTGIAAPVTAEASAEHRNATTAPICAGRTQRA